MNSVSAKIFYSNKVHQVMKPAPADTNPASKFEQKHLYIWEKVGAKGPPEPRPLPFGFLVFLQVFQQCFPCKIMAVWWQYDVLFQE